MGYRDPKRIEVFITKLKEHWLCVPDWRFGQLMINFFGYVANRTKQDIFFIEEEEMTTLLDEYFESLFKSQDT